MLSTLFFFFALFLGLVIVVTNAVNPKNNTLIWVHSIVWPSLLAFILSYIYAFLVTRSDNELTFWMGCALGYCILPTIISAIALLVLLWQKKKLGDDFVFPMLIYTLIGVSLLLGGLLFMHNF